MPKLSMTTFTNLNKGKFAFIFKISFVLSALIFFALYFLPFTDKPKPLVVVAIHIGSAFLLSTMITAIIFLSGYFYFTKQEAIFESDSLKHFIKKYNFQTSLINDKNKWQLTQRTKTGEIDHYPIIIFKRHDKPNVVIFVFELDLRNPEQVRYIRSRNFFADKKISVGEGAIAIPFNVNENIAEHIIQLVKTFQENGIESLKEAACHR